MKWKSDDTGLDIVIACYIVVCLIVYFVLQANNLLRGF